MESFVPIDRLGSKGRGAAADLDIEAELRGFEEEERKRLGLGGREQWWDPVPSTFTASQRAGTTLLVSGLTMAHDYFIQAALQGIGYKVQHLDCPDNAALQYGKEFGNRAQCNPTYFTVGNLVKHLSQLRDSGVPVKDIVEKYVFVTAGACGPCRFGMYSTEYRKALRDAGFDGFRVLLFQQQGGVKQATGEELGLKIDLAFFISLAKSIFIGDALNLMMYRIRPYEVEAGAAEAALDRCKIIIYRALAHHESLTMALVRCRQELAAVEVDKTKVKPKVGIIGEFWAMTTEGDGNYKLQGFLEEEGAEPDVQIVAAWILYNIWENKWDTLQRADLRGIDGGAKGLAGVEVNGKLRMMAVADRVLRTFFQGIAALLGLRDYHLPDMDEVAEVSHKYYNNHLRGGEGHMEVGKLILNVLHSKVNMTLSVKPFGCMPSSGVSDGVQTLVTERHPGAIFLPIETSGDGAVNVQSRVQMMLFKAKKHAQDEVDKACAKWGVTLEEVRGFVARHPEMSSALYMPPHVGASTAVNMVHAAGPLMRPGRALLEAWRWRPARATAGAAMA
jgi:predicted nucleotide-binding protein (sugar kinase/HSP70/actin superfamily)